MFMETLKKVGVGLLVLSPLAMFAQTDATSLATDATTAMSILEPAAITIAGFFIILRLAKRASKG